MRCQFTFKKDTMASVIKKIESVDTNVSLRKEIVALMILDATCI